MKLIVEIRTPVDATAQELADALAKVLPDGAAITVRVRA
jgi:hypothetical protein